MTKKKANKKIPWIIAGIILFSSLATNIFQYKQNKNLKKTGIFVKVIEVIDGDTFVTENKQRIRLVGVDAPEMGLCLSEEAKEELKDLVENKEVGLKEAFADKYGRLVALIYKEDKLINETMLTKGFGRFDGAKNSQSETLKEAYEKAREENLGIFSTTCYQKENTENPECSIKGNIDKGNGKKTYHFPGCREYDTTIVEKDLGEQWFCTEKEAQEAGYTKSSNCYDKNFQQE